MEDKSNIVSVSSDERCEAIYARQSMEKEDSISIEGQVERCRKFAENPSTVKVYEDKGYSGKDIHRPAFTDLLRDIKLGKIKKVIIYRLDRMTRSLLDFDSLLILFQEYDVTFESTHEKFDTSTPVGQAMVQILMVFAELERKTIQQRVKDNYYQRGERGMYLGGPPPYGFERVSIKTRGKKGTFLSPISEQTEIIVAMYEKYGIEGMSLSDISQWLNEIGIETAKGTAWDGGKVSRLLRNPVYVKADADVYAYFNGRGCNIANDLKDYIGENGCYLYGKREANQRKYTDVKDHFLSLAPHRGIIDSELWLRCQTKLDKNSQIGNAGQGQYSWLSGLVKCGKCGYCMTVTTYKNYKYFRCRGKDMLRNCDGQNITQYVDAIEASVEGRLTELLKLLPKVEMPKDSKSVRGNSSAKMQLVELETKIDTLIENLTVCTGAAAQRLNDKINELCAERSDILETLSNELKDEIENPYERIMEIAENWENAALEEKKLIANLLIEKVYIDDDKISVKWKL